MVVESGVSLTVDPAVVVEFVGKYALTVQGTLSAVGTASSLIVFTSAKASPAAGDWVGVHVSSTTLLRFVKISYADAGVWCEGPGNAARLEACTFTDNGSGIYLANQSTPVITRDAATSTGCTITKNQHGIYIALVGPNSIPQPDISYNSFLDNTTYDVYTQYYYDNSALTINARNNWWGTTDVGTIASHIHDYTDNAACPVVDFNGFLDKAGGTPSTVTLVSGRVLNGGHVAGVEESVQSSRSGGGGKWGELDGRSRRGGGICRELRVDGTRDALGGGDGGQPDRVHVGEGEPGGGGLGGGTRQFHDVAPVCENFVCSQRCRMLWIREYSASGGLHVHQQRLWHQSGESEHTGDYARCSDEHRLYDHEQSVRDFASTDWEQYHTSAGDKLQYDSRQHDLRFFMRVKVATTRP